MDLEKINLKTSFRKEKLEAYKRCLGDLDKTKRINSQECVLCYYEYGILSGQAFTTSHCRECEAITRYPNTNTGIYCISCAKKYKICHKCGCDLALKMRRKNDPSKSNKTT